MADRRRQPVQPWLRRFWDCRPPEYNVVGATYHVARRDHNDDAGDSKSRPSGLEDVRYQAKGATQVPPLQIRSYWVRANRP